MSKIRSSAFIPPVFPFKVCFSLWLTVPVARAVCGWYQVHFSVFGLLLFHLNPN